MSISRAIELFMLPISLIQRALKALVILTPAFIGKFAPVCRISRIGRRGSERRNIRRLSLWPDIELRAIIMPSVRIRHYSSWLLLPPSEPAILTVGGIADVCAIPGISGARRS